MTDTHTHIYLPGEDGKGDIFSPEEYFRRALDAGVSRMIFPNIDRTSIEPLLKLHHLFPEHSYTAVGLHPTEVFDNWKDEFNYIFSAFSDETPVAVGEVGMDLYWDKTFREQQIAAFTAQVEKAEKMDLPVIIHQREALDETLGVLQDAGTSCPPCVFHSFTGSPTEADRILSSGDFMFGINGVATFKNAKDVRETIKLIGIERIMLETDSPYLAPVPKRGKRNESAFLPYIASVIADTLDILPEEVKSVTDSNATRFFNL